MSCVSAGSNAASAAGGCDREAASPAALPDLAGAEDGISPSSEMICRIDARISSMEGSCAAPGLAISVSH
jgi:hypothetical protein